MPTKPSTGLIQQKRARRLFEILLDYNNHNLDVKLSKKLTINWEKKKLELSVMGTLESLIELINADGYPKSEVLNKENIINVIYFFEKHLEILSNFSTQGSAQRQFTFKLWDTDKEKNLKKFDELCKEKDSEKLPNRRAMSNGHLQAEVEIQSNQEDLGKNLTSSDPSPENLRKQLTELRNKCKNLEDACQAEKQANQNLNKQIKTANSHLTLALYSLLIFTIPIAMDSKAIYNYLNDIYPKNNSSVSSPDNTNNSGSNTSASDFADLSRQINTASSTTEKQKTNSESKAGEKSQCP